MFSWQFQHVQQFARYQLDVVGMHAQTPRYWIKACQERGCGLGFEAWGNDVSRDGACGLCASRPPSADLTRLQALLPSRTPRAIDPQQLLRIRPLELFINRIDPVISPPPLSHNIFCLHRCHYFLSANILEHLLSLFSNSPPQQFNRSASSCL